jgi:membrane fusion protein (multidrug efflux system)
MARAVYPLLAVLLLAPLVPAGAQQAPSVPAVGVVKAARKAITESTEFIGRIQAVERVDLTARVTAFLDKRRFAEGTEVKQGELLYQLERGPFEADVQAKQAAVKQAQALLKNADLTLARAQDLLAKAVGTAATADAAEASQQSQAAQLLAAQAQLRQSQINLDYTEIKAPVAGRIGRTSITPGNVVSPGSGVLATIVSQDPMYVVFSVPVRTALELRQRIAHAGSFDVARVRIKLPDGRVYGHTGKLDFLNNTVTGNTDTLTLRATIPNPAEQSATGAAPAAGVNRELVDGEFVGVLLEGVQPVEVLAIPRAAVLSDQAGDYVYVVDSAGKAQRQRLKLGQSTPTLAIVTSGLEEGQLVIVDGLQRVRPGQPVAPGPAANATEADNTGGDLPSRRKL